MSAGCVKRGSAQRGVITPAPCSLYLAGRIHEQVSGVAALISSVSVLLDGLHAAQTRPVRPVSRPRRSPSVPAADLGCPLVRCHYLHLPAAHMPPRGPVPAPRGPGAWSRGRFGPRAAQDV